MGTPDFSVPALEALINDGHEILAVYTQPPRPAGRGHKERKSPVHITAEKYNITVRTPKSLKNEAEQNIFADTNADMAVVVAYGLILPKAVLDSCPCINIHASILPRWRGAAPIQRAILAADSETGVTIMQMDEGLDTGDMLIWDKVKITDDMTAGKLHDVLSEMGADLIVKYIKQKDTIVAVKQEGQATYAAKINKNEASLNCSENVADFSARVRAFCPFPGAFFIYRNEKFKVLEASFKITSHNYEFGKIIDDKPTIAIKDGFFNPAVIQRQGKKPMPINQFVRGFKFVVGDVIT